MDRLGGRYAERNKVDQNDRYCMVSHICGIKKKKKKRNTGHSKDETDSKRIDLYLLREERESGVSSCKVLHIEWVNKVLSYSTGN